MIATPAFDIGAEAFWDIGPEGFKQAEKRAFDNPNGKKPIQRYVAASESVLLIEKRDKIEIIVGRFVKEDVLQNVMGYALKQNKLLELRKCEILDNLRMSDRMVVLCNEFITNMQPQLSDLDPDDVDFL